MSLSRFSRGLATVFLGAALSSILTGSGLTDPVIGVGTLGSFFYLLAVAADKKGSGSIRALGEDFEDVLDSIELDQQLSMKIHV